MINFPDAPTIGQVHRAAGVIYTFNGQGWTTTDDQAPNGNFTVMVSDVPPAVTDAGYLWWESDTGILWILYGDTDTVQWVQATAMMSTENVGAMDFPLNPLPNDEYLGYVFNGTGWVIKNTGGPDIYVELAGDTMQGDLRIAKDAPALFLDRVAGGNAAGIHSTIDGVLDWTIALGSSGNFAVHRYDALGTLLDTPFMIDKLNAAATFFGPFALKSALPTLVLNSTGGGNSVLTFAHNDAEQWKITGAPGSLTFSGFIGVGFNNILTLGATADFSVSAVGPIVNFKFGAVVVGSITTDGATTVYNTTSDGRLKEDLQPFDAGVILDKLQVYDFAWKDSGERMHGVVAQEAIEVYPLAVTHTPADWWGVDYSRFVPLLLQEVKALRERVRQLELKT